jgi:lipoate-protein ligase A
MRCEEKIPGGKLVCVEIWPVQSGAGRPKAGSVRVSGDFFLHPEDAIYAIEDSMKGLPLDSEQDEIRGRIQEALDGKGATLIGVSPEDIARMFIKAVEG